MSQIRTVSDAKRDFYRQHNRPINSIFRRVVEELLVEMHLVSVNVDFRYDPFFALGVVTSFERFMQGYRPESDKASIFNAMCQAVGDAPETYKNDATALVELAKRCSGQQLIDCFSRDNPPEGAGELWSKVEAIAKNEKFKYSRLFAIGLYTFLGEAEPALIEDADKRDEMLSTLTEAMNLPGEKMKKDLDLYRSNLEKMTQVLAVIEDALVAERKRREKAEAEANKPADNVEETQPKAEVTDSPAE
ncbi:photosystem II biogenesis protein Psp29 [[Limnothrix rosea] IAM M-220]|uniref:photosystem II biogenesis protein Psp29 n=1 Tax=[Limnothrix rosea] IAM M-220 TaxID=454133 RepID=UPI00095D9F61|nr:photosystem II biogenesis protein Psp29 [[Limnothrix rosea] IAM M-220]OKH18357.1 photosystem II biogenesis protein Psp29 [[Limnothrix rosea] IAM M-220]